MLIAHLTDLHVRPRGKAAYGVVDTNGLTAKAFAAIEALDRKPDVVVLSGDLTDYGLEDEYTRLRELLLALSAPVYMVPGNHDDRDTYLRCNADLDYIDGSDGFAHFVVETRPVRLIGLDTILPGDHAGEMCGARLAWLDARLAEAPETPTFIFMHHPPIVTGLPSLDKWGLHGAAAFAEVMERHRQVVRIASGHWHVPTAGLVGGALCTVGTSTAHQGILKLDPKNAASGFRLGGQTMLLHHWNDRSMQTYTAPIEPGFGPLAGRWDRERPDDNAAIASVDGVLQTSAY